MDYQREITVNKFDYPYINRMLNLALRDNSILPKTYDTYCNLAKSFGFKFGQHWQLL